MPENESFQNPDLLIDDKILLDNLGKIAYTLDRTYIQELSDSSKYACLPFDKLYRLPEDNSEVTEDDARISIDYESNIRACKVIRWVFNKDEKPGETFKNVLGAFVDGSNSLALVVNREPDKVEIYFVVKNSIEGGNEQSSSNLDLLEKSIHGNFQGSSTQKVDRSKPKISNENGLYLDDISEIFERDNFKSVSALSNMPSEYSEDYISQGIDKVLESIIPNSKEDSYCLVFLAESLTLNEIRETLSGYEELATAIQPFLEYQYTKGKNDTNTKTESSSIAESDTISNSIFKTHSINVGGSISKSIANTIGASLSAGISALVGNMFPSIGAGLSIARTVTNSVGLSAGYGYSWGTSKTVSHGNTKTNGQSSSVSLGNSETSTYKYQSFLVKNIQERLVMMMDRINKSQANGLWKYATYVLAKDAASSKNIANLIKSTTQGKDSYVMPAIVQEWSKKEGDNTFRDDFSEIKKYIKYFIHPIFISRNCDDGGNLKVDSMLVDATSLVSTDELSQIMVLPKNALQGLPILQGVSFGREPNGINKLENDLTIGNAYHMYEEYKDNKIKLSKNSLTSHMFITGSTGSGKSNTVYKLLSELVYNKKCSIPDCHFLVIEPAKGEYKNIFGNKDDVSVYGTNQNLMPLLKINPFSFPEEMHILEHLDRLVEIFNVCWPMSAAMPAVLKEAIEKSYEDAGWNLTDSVNPYGSNFYPNFSDVTRNIRTIIDSSEYNSDNKGAYKGSLITRLKTLSNGINGLLFTTDELSNQELFDKNVIVDLSRVGSVETKSLIMGLLVLKLQEYRMTSKVMNSDLKHVTVLEEAHNLLKRTSTNQSQESGNLLGKSVEMLTNAIAEMRTYGEGFIIADQAPGLLDKAVIRNTNTKIIMRLPDLEDRELVGKAANLNDDQIKELAKLPLGVAAIYQNDWLEPVLCKIGKAEIEDSEYVLKKHPKKEKKDYYKERVTIARLLCKGVAITDDGQECRLKEDLEKLELSSSSKVVILRSIKRPNKEPLITKIAPVISELFPNFKNHFIDYYNNNLKEYPQWTIDLKQEIKKYLPIDEEERVKNIIIQSIVTSYLYNDIGQVLDLEKWSETGKLWN